MKTNLLLKYVKPYLFSLFFTAAMTSLLWITATYGSLNAVPIAAGLCALMYSGLALAALVNLLRGNKLLDGSSADVLSVGTQKGIRAAGVAFALPALIYCGIFAYLVKSYDYSEAAEQRIADFSKFEVSVFGLSKIGDAIAAQYSVPTALTPIEPTPEVAPQKDVDFGPYMADMQVQIKKVWRPERGDISRHTEVFFSADKNGNVSKLRIERSSGSEVSDKAALDAVENAAPLKPLPEGAPESVDIKFTFDYNTPISTPLSPAVSYRDTPEHSSEYTDTFSSSASDGN